MQDVSISINGSELSISKSDVREAYDRTEESLDSDNLEHKYSPWHFIEVDGEKKPINTVFYNIESVNQAAESIDEIHSVQKVFEELGFELYDRKEHAEEILRDTFEEILEDYPERQGTASKDKRLYQLLVNKAPNFVKHIANKNFDEKTFNFKGTAGQGNWPNIPWVAAKHPEETDTTQKGVYVVYLFDPEKQVVYATLNQGTTEIIEEHGKRKARKILEDRAEEIREKVGLEGFSAENPDLSDNDKLYEESTIYQKKYDLEDLPEAGMIAEDFVKLAEAYLDYLESKDDLDYPEIDEENTGRSIEDFENEEVTEPEIDATENLSADFNLDFGNLHFTESEKKSIKSQIEASLNSGKHIIFTGPPGTGKTELAEIVAREMKSTDENVTGFQLTTATSDWSTFDTVGGYRPEDDGSLEFKPGHILRRFKDGQELKNEALVIDEINRANIDKAFGQLFTVLSGQKVQLPFTKGEEDKEIEIVPGEYFKERSQESIRDNEYVVPESWRILATMNTYDKTSLYEMSYAFMRRFSFIRIEAPEIPENTDERNQLLDNYIEAWDLNGEPISSEAEVVGEIWYRVNNAVEGREIGPAIAKDMLEFLKESRNNDKNANTAAITNYIFPQMEGVPDRDKIVESLLDGDLNIDEDRLKRVAENMLQVDLSGD